MELNYSKYDSGEDNKLTENDEIILKVSMFVFLVAV